MKSRLEIVEDEYSRTIYTTIFRLTSISDLYGPATAVEWAQSLLDDPELLAAFARPRQAAMRSTNPPPASGPAAA